MPGIKDAKERALVMPPLNLKLIECFCDFLDNHNCHYNKIDESHFQLPTLASEVVIDVQIWNHPATRPTTPTHIISMSLAVTIVDEKVDAELISQDAEET